MFFKFKKPETREFRYQPRYYNPKEETLQSRIDNYSQKQDGELAKARVSQSFASYRLKDRQKSKTWSAANMRLVLILLGFFALFYFVSNKYSGLFMKFLSPVELNTQPQQDEDEVWADEELPPIESK